MADNQVNLSLTFRPKDHSKSKKTSSWTVKNSWPKRPPPVSDISKTSDLDSKLLSKPSNPPTSIRNAHSPATSPSEERSWRESASQQKCKEPLWSEEIIFTTFPSTTDTRRDTETSQCTAHPLSLSRKEISLWLVNADLCARPFISTFWKSSPTKLSATLESNSCFSDYVKYISLNHLFLLGLNKVFVKNFWERGREMPYYEELIGLIYLN